MTHPKALDEIETLRDENDYLRHIIRNAAVEFMDNYVLRVLYKLHQQPYIGVSGDYYHWPYAGEISEISLLEEMIWVRQQSGGESFGSAFSGSVKSEAERLIEKISESELDVSFAFICSILRPDDLFTSNREREYVGQELRNQVAHAIANYDMTTIQEAWIESGIAEPSEFEGEDA